MKTDDEIIETEIRAEAEPIAKIIYDNVFARDPRYPDWEAGKYKAPEQPEGFARMVCYSVANEILALKGE